MQQQLYGGIYFANNSENIFWDYGFGECGLGTYCWYINTLLFFIPDKLKEKKL